MAGVDSTELDSVSQLFATPLTTTWGSNVKSQGFRYVVRMGNVVLFAFSCNVYSTDGTVLVLPVALAGGWGIATHQSDVNMQGYVEAEGANLVAHVKTANWMVVSGWGHIA